MATNGALRAWVEAVAGVFAAQHPELRVTVAGPGSNVAMAGLYAATFDVAVVGREATPNELKAYEWEYGYPPDQQALGPGSPCEPGPSPALAVYVRADNPLRTVTLQQLDAIIGADRRRGAPNAIECWKQLGVSGRPQPDTIHVYLPDTESGTGRFFRSAVLLGSKALRWEMVTETRDVLTAVARDPLGLAVGPCRDPVPEGVRLVPVPGGQDALRRTIYAYARRGPAKSGDPVIMAFRQALVSSSPAYPR